MTNKNKKGFTIIEVVLVLAIAGLIFLMVFIALPALQRSQRNTQRANDMSRILTAVNQYQANNQGKTPWGDAATVAFDSKFTKRYIDSTCPDSVGVGATVSCTGNEFKDPDGTAYIWANTTSATSAIPSSVTAIDHKIYVARKAKCGSTENSFSTTSGYRDIAFFYYMEGGSIRCFDNQQKDCDV